MVASLDEAEKLVTKLTELDIVAQLRIYKTDDVLINGAAKVLPIDSESNIVRLINPFQITYESSGWTVWLPLGQISISVKVSIKIEEIVKAVHNYLHMQAQLRDDFLGIQQAFHWLQKGGFSADPESPSDIRVQNGEEIYVLHLELNNWEVRIGDKVGFSETRRVANLTDAIKVIFDTSKHAPFPSSAIVFWDFS